MTNEALEQAEQAIIDGDDVLLETCLAQFRKTPQVRPWRNGRGNPYALQEADIYANARFIIIREQHMDSWASFTALQQERRNPGSVVAQFEMAADAIVEGDRATLEKLLAENPALIHERSKRLHRATLLHYTGSNGIEGYRQKAPATIAGIAKLLLESGADVNAIAEMYGRDTALGLASTSIHPVNSGVMLPLLETLLDYGAKIDDELQPGSAVNSCLANGRLEAAIYLASRGAYLNLEGAAGLGRLDRITAFFEPDGRLAGNASANQLHAGFCWACEYGQQQIVEWLLDRGVSVHTQLEGLQWAAFKGDAGIIALLLPRGLPLDMINRWGGTTLSAAVYGAEVHAPVDYSLVLEMLLHAGANAQAFEGLPQRIERLLKRSL